jgi:hypothetical protein
MSGSSLHHSTNTVPWPLALLAVGLLSLDCAGGISRIASSDRYTVTTELMLGPGNLPLTACRVMAASEPPASCSGVEVRGVDVKQVPGSRRLSNGAILTDSVRLVGMWDGSALNLTQPPHRATPPRPPAMRVAAQATPRALAAQQRLVADWQDLQRQGLHVMECSTDGDAVVVLVPVADQRTVSELTQRYGPVVVNAWLQRA